MAWLSAGAASATAVDAASLWSPTISTAGVSCAAAAAGRGATIIAAVSSLYFQVDINGFLTLLVRLLSSRFSPSFSTISTSGRRHPCRRGCPRSEEHTSELQPLMRISYAVFCLKKKKKHPRYHI